MASTIWPVPRHRPRARVRGLAAARQLGVPREDGSVADSDDPVSQLVVIGSSAGGIDALSTVLRTLPQELPAPVLVAQHLDPNRPSHLTEILRRQTTLRVESVTDHSLLESSTILVIPPSRHAEITDHD